MSWFHRRDRAPGIKAKVRVVPQCFGKTLIHAGHRLEESSDSNRTTETPVFDITDGSFHIRLDTTAG